MSSRPESFRPFPVASDTLLSVACRPLRPPSVARWKSDGRDILGLPWASESMSSSVAVCRSCVSLREMPISTPCVKTLCPLIWPYAPSGANVTALVPASSRQFDGTLIRKSSPSL